MTHLMDGSEILVLTRGVISAKKQEGPFSVDLTVRSIFRVEKGGALDFGGGEFREASAIPLTPIKKSREDQFGWWNLVTGVCLITFNETIEPVEGGLLIIFPHQRLLAAGSSHAAVALDRLSHDTRITLNVGALGLDVKQNARLSRAVIVTGTRK